jgi:hypothetical protein
MGLIHFASLAFALALSKDDGLRFRRFGNVYVATISIAAVEQSSGQGSHRFRAHQVSLHHFERGTFCSKLSKGEQLVLIVSYNYPQISSPMRSIDRNFALTPTSKNIVAAALVV